MIRNCIIFSFMTNLLGTDIQLIICIGVLRLIGIIVPRYGFSILIRVELQTIIVKIFYNTIIIKL